MKIIISIIAFFDRQYNLMFHRDKCVGMVFDDNYFEYRDVIVSSGGEQLRYLGKQYWKFIDIK